MKKVQFANLSNKEKECALNEIRLMASISSPYIIAYKEAFFDGNLLCIVMELADGGDLLKKIESHKKKGTKFQEYEIWRAAIQMVKGLKALHDAKILHRDLKSANVFLQSDGDIKLGDFNVSKIAKKGVLCTQTGTPYYASPEVWKDLPYNFKSDIWSFGVILYEICALHPPFMATSMEQLYRKVIQGAVPSIPNNFSHDLSNLIRQCLQQNPDRRPSCDEILEMHSVQQKLTDTLKMNDHKQSIKMIDTIKFNKNINIIKKHLPKPSYSREDIRESNGRVLLSHDSARINSLHRKVEVSGNIPELYIPKDISHRKLRIIPKPVEKLNIGVMKTPLAQKCIKEIINPLPSQRGKRLDVAIKEKQIPTHRNLRNINVKYEFKSEERAPSHINVNQLKIKINCENIQKCDKIEIGKKGSVNYKLDLIKPSLVQNGVNILSSCSNKHIVNRGPVNFVKKHRSDAGIMPSRISHEYSCVNPLSDDI
jgi:serine/threonine protein kinase